MQIFVFLNFLHYYCLIIMKQNRLAFFIANI